MRVGELIMIELLLTPLLITAVALIERKFGQKASGFIVGLPLTTGPVILALYLKFNESFVSLTLNGVMASIVSTAIFCIVYYTVSTFDLRFPVSITAAWLAFAASATIFQIIDPDFLLASICAFIALLMGLLLKTKMVRGKHVKMSLVNGVVFRAISATTLVILITTLSNSLGSQLSGIVSNTPVFISIFVIFNHAFGGEELALNFLVGTLRGSFSYFLFFLVLEVMLPVVNVWMGFSVSTASALALNFVLFQLSRKV